ncbi:unnamed protein product, partial [Brassica rapa subsp. trilocularis]
YHLLRDPSFEGDSSSTRVQFSINSNNLLSRNNRSRSSIFPAKECQQVMEKQGSSGEDDNQSLALSYIGSSTQILNYQEEEVCKWSSVATHAERELNGLSTVWLMNVALSLSRYTSLCIISWLTILVIVEYDFRKETSKDSRAGSGGRVIGVSARGGEAGGGEVAGGGDAGGGEADASGGETVGAGTCGLCGGCGGEAAGLITGATFGAGGGETVGVTAGGGVVGDAGGGVAETGGTTVVGCIA